MVTITCDKCGKNLKYVNVLRVIIEMEDYATGGKNVKDESEFCEDCAKLVRLMVVEFKSKGVI